MRNSRRQFLGRTGCTAAALLGTRLGAPVLAQAPGTADTPPARRSEPLPDALVHEWVWRGHFDVDGVKRLLERQPTLLNAVYDWGGGDYELAIGGAGHMGRRDIAEFLLSRGARMDVFVAAMLGRLDIVKATLTAYPSLVTSKGPHGFTLMHHAKAGNTDAGAVLEYLQSLEAQ